MEPNQRKKLYDMLPVITFIITYFFLHLFDWMEATQFLIAILVSNLTYFAMVSEYKEEVKDKTKHRKLNYYVGLLSLMFILILVNGIIHWNRLIHINYRMGLLFALVLVFFIILFRAIRVLADFKELENIS